MRPHRNGPAWGRLVILLAGLHLLLLLLHFAAGISTPDASSYYVQARLIATQCRTDVQVESPLQYTGPHWNETAPGHLYCTHPPGLPALLAVAYRLGGPSAALLISPLLCSLTLIGLFLLVRMWVGAGWGLLAAALMAFNPVANEHALFGDSHAAISFFLVWGVFFLARWMDTRRTRWALAAGLFLGILPTIHYPEVLYPFCAAAFVLVYRRRYGFSLRSLLTGATATALPILALLIRNQIAYGAFWKTGYAVTHEQSAFAVRYFFSNAPQYLLRLLIDGPGLAFLFGLVGLGWMCLCKAERPRGLLIALLILPITLLYISWYWRPDPQTPRFLLPTFYLYGVASVWLLRRLTRDRPRRVWAVAVALFVPALAWGLPESLRRMHHLQITNSTLAKVTQAIESNVEQGAVVITHEGIAQHLDFIGRWRLICLRWATPRPPGAPAPMGPLIGPFAALAAKTPPKLEPSDVWKWAGTRRVFLVADEESLRLFESRLSTSDHIVRIGKISMPAMRIEGGPGRLGPARGDPWDVRIGPPPNAIFDVVLNGRPLYIAEWVRPGRLPNSGGDIF